ncbi:permease-like cell division protein FtsX [Nonomuraea longicatena]|uniref:FtsX extracellular domain-containing protein n=1 Tax=Nonomuraea longicatena TaxID=83682 RepID=A0ABN1NV16_9ACTN
MNDSVETRLRDALVAAGDTVDRTSLRPLVPTQRRRFRVPARFVVIGAALAIAGAIGAVTLTPADEETVVLAAGVSPFMAGDWTAGKPTIAVFLCKAGSPSPSCGAVLGSGEGTVDSPQEVIAEGKAVTPSQILDLKRALEARPEIMSITFEDAQTAYKNFLQAYGSNPEVARAVTVNDLPESFRLTLKPDADWSPVAEAAKDMPGVDIVINQKCTSEQRDKSMCYAR